MRTLIVIAPRGEGLGDAEPLLTRDRPVRVLETPTEASALATIAEVGAVDVLARHESCGTALRLAAAAPEGISALVLESPRPAENYAELLPKLTMPVLVLYGTLDAKTSPDLGRGYKALLPNGWFVMVYNAGHDIANDRPEAYAELVGDFLTRGVRFTISEQSSRLNP